MKSLRTVKSTLDSLHTVPELLDAIPRRSLSRAAFPLFGILAVMPVAMLLVQAAAGYLHWFWLSDRYTRLWNTGLQIPGLLCGLLSIAALGKSILQAKRSKQSVNQWCGRHVVPLLLLALLLWSALSTAFSIDPATSLLGDSYRQEGLLTYISYYGWFCAALLLQPPQRKKLLCLFTLSALIVALVTLFDGSFLRRVLFLVSSLHAAPFENTNHSAYYLCLACMAAAALLLLAEKTLARFMWGAVFAILLLALLINGSMGPYLATLAGLLLLLALCLFRKRTHWKPALVLLLLFILVSGLYSLKDVRLKQDTTQLAQDAVTVVQPQTETETKDGAGSGRWVLWRLAAQFTLERPLFGYGPDTFSQLYVREGRSPTRPHCTPLQISASLGIPALALYLAALLVYAISFLKRKNPSLTSILLFCAGTAYFISSLVGNSMYYTSPYFCVLWGMAVSQTNQ